MKNAPDLFYPYDPEPSFNGHNTDKPRDYSRAKKFGAAILAGTALGVGLIGAAVKFGPNVTQEVRGTAVATSELENTHEMDIKEEAFAIAHRYDSEYGGGCEVAAFKDTRHASEALPDAQDKTVISLTLKLTRSPQAEEAMGKYMYDDSVQWLDPIALSTDIISDTDNVDGVSIGPFGEPLIEIDEQKDLEINADGSYNVQASLYLPGEASTDDKPPLSLMLHTDSWYDNDLSTKEVSNPTCAGSVVYTDGEWQFVQ